MSITTVAALCLLRYLSATAEQDAGEVSSSEPLSGDVDLATFANQLMDSTEVELSPKMFRAIQAVERYRAQVQRKLLTSDEAVFDNFNIRVKPGESSIGWLTGGEKKTCYLVVLSPRFQPGEVVAMDRHAKIGRVSLYAVRKSDYQIIRTQLGER
jgi:hypothetical protein